MEDKNLNIEEVLKTDFETVYQEYKSYETFIKGIVEEVKKDREGFAKFAQENSTDVDKIVDKLIEVNEKPILYQNDLMRLQLRLVYSYDLVKGIVEIPQEIKTEIENSRPKQLFKIENGEAVVLDQELIDKIKQKTAENSREYLKNLLNGK
jgi:hypothetical protein